MFQPPDSVPPQEVWPVVVASNSAVEGAVEAQHLPRAGTVEAQHLPRAGTVEGLQLCPLCLYEGP